MADGRPNDSLAGQAGRYLGVGMTWALSTALFLYLGSLADRWLGTDPWLTLIGAFVGAAAGFYHLYSRLIRHGGEGMNAKRDDAGKGRRPE